MNLHSIQCDNQKREFEAWLSKWPEACRLCGGEGLKHYAGTFLDPPDTQPCVDCVEEDKCPRCGKSGLEVSHEIDQGYYDVFSCPHCGWDEGKLYNTKYPESADMVCPPWECCCDSEIEAMIEACLRSNSDQPGFDWASADAAVMSMFEEDYAVLDGAGNTMPEGVRNFDQMWERVK